MGLGGEKKDRSTTHSAAEEEGLIKSEGARKKDIYGGLCDMGWDGLVRSFVWFRAKRGLVKSSRLLCSIGTEYAGCVQLSGGLKN